VISKTNLRFQRIYVRLFIYSSTSLLLLLLFLGCTQFHALLSSEEKLAKTTIQKNKTQAEKAKEDYNKLQRQRGQDG
jgi:hypothetical protein